MRTALLLAAGESKRFGGNKLLHKVRDSELGEDYMVRVAARKFLEAGVFDEVLIIVGYQFSKIVEVLADLDVKFVFNPDYSVGMSTSVIAGIRRVFKHSKLVAVHPTDVPFIKISTIKLLVNTLPTACRDDCILIPRYCGKGGHPIVLAGSLVREAISIREAEQGLRGLILRHKEHVSYLDVEDRGVVVDIDTPEDLAAEVSVEGAERASNLDA